MLKAAAEEDDEVALAEAPLVTVAEETDEEAVVVLSLVLIGHRGLPHTSPVSARIDSLKCRFSLLKGTRHLMISIVN